MAQIYGDLKKAAFETLSSDPAGNVTGRFWWNSTDGRPKFDDGTNKYALLRNDLKLIIGNNGTANNNIRLHRGANSVLQFVQGGDSTAEGTLATSLAQISAKVEGYTDAGKPAAGNAGRIIFVTDLLTFLGDNGTGFVPLGGGGGGGALQWIEDAVAPVPDIENNSQVYKYTAADTQYLYTFIRVPTSYVAGRPIKMKMLFYSPDTTGNVLLQTQATLIEPGVSAVDTTTNQRTSTNSAVSLSGTANRVEAAEFDLTDTSGAINSVAVAAGDIIKVRLTRGTDTATSDVRGLVYGAEVTFN